jgi:RNA helicase HrpA
VGLPILKYTEEIVDAVRRNQVTIVVGETGSGKTTQIPAILYKAGLHREKLIGITEPRRIAATSTAEFVATQLGTTVGDLVGYKIRFTDEIGSATKLKFMTDGILLREMQNDPDLKQYSVIIVDEAHERSCNIDFILGLLKDLLTRREDLRIVVASATIDQNKFSAYFGGAPVVNVSGRMYPVKVVWSEDPYSEEDRIEKIVTRVVDIHKGQPQGDILVFMTGQEDINQVSTAIENADLKNIMVLPVYGALPPDEQQKIFRPYPGKRKVVVATNIAETSITIDGVVYVLDSGLVKQSNFHPETGIQSLDVVEHSQAGCQQRTGRAGRTQPGTCYRMYSEASFKKRRQFTEPEIKRMSLASVVLAMESIGIENIREFDFIEQPDHEAFEEAYETLIALGAILRNQPGLTPIGESMARLPLEPRIARMVVAAEQHGCVKDVATIAAFLSISKIFFRPKDPLERMEADSAHERFKRSRSDALTFLEVWKQYSAASSPFAWCKENYINGKSMREVVNTRNQLLEVLGRLKITLSETENPKVVERAVVTGLADNLFEHYSRFSYRPLCNVKLPLATIHPGSSMFRFTPRFIVATEIVRTTGIFARNCTPVEIEWLPEILPDMFFLSSPVVDSYVRGQETAVATNLIMMKREGQPAEEIGSVRHTISIAEASTIQNENIRSALAKGLVPLVFSKDPMSTSFIERCIGTYRGTKYFAHTNVQLGVTYYCSLEAPLWAGGQHYATPVFQVWDLPGSTPAAVPPAPVPAKAVNTQPAVKKPVSNESIAALAQKFGRVK